MLNVQGLSRPGYSPRRLAIPQKLSAIMEARGLSLLQMREIAEHVSLRECLCSSAGIGENELRALLQRLEKLLPRAGDPALAVAPISIPPLGGIVAPEQRAKLPGRQEPPAVEPFWRQGCHALPAAFDHLDFFVKKPVIAQRGPNCVGHGCRNAAEVYAGMYDKKLSGIFAWQYAMEKTGFPIPPTGTWPDVVLEGMVKRGTCLEKLHPEENYREDAYIKPSAKALTDAKKRKIEAFVNLRSRIGDPDTIDLMCLLLHGSRKPKLKGRPLIIGVGVPEEWLLPESLTSGVRPIPISQHPKGGHCFVLVGYFHHQGQRWFIGVENWGDRIGSRNPFNYPKIGLCFIPAQFFNDSKWFWDLAICATRAEARIFQQSPVTTAVSALSSRSCRRSVDDWLWQAQLALGGTAASLAFLRLLFPGSWW